MHKLSSGDLWPASYRVSSPCTSISPVWRQYRSLSAASSPGFSDSKDEEDMDIDPDENSPQTDSVPHRSSSSLVRRCRSLAPFSLSDLHISGQDRKPAQSHEKPVSLKHSYSFKFMSGEKTSQLSSASTYCAKQSAYEWTNELGDSDCDLSDVTRMSSSGTGAAEKAQLVLIPWSEANDDSEARGTLRPASLPQGEHKLLFSAKSFVFSVAFLMIAVAVFVSYVQQSRATQCVDHIDVESLRHELQRRVHGQHIAISVVVKRLEEFTSASDRRQLVMSFHGWTGIGKNFMSSIIARYLPLTNVHKFIVPLHFAHGTDREALLLSEWIISNMTSSCGLHLFIIDEIDKAPGSWMHSFRETLNKLSLLSDVSCHAVFLLLTNDGATEINTATTELLMNGGVREDLELSDLVSRFSSQFYSELMSSKLVDQTVPFLPLERRHVAQCTEAELRLRHVDVTQQQQLVDDIVNNLSYFPANVSLFSSSGCRRIVHLVDLFL